MKHALGWKRPAQHRGLRLAGAAAALSSHEVPDRGDLGRVLPPIDDQGALGSCTGNAVARALYALFVWQGLPPIRASRLALYYGGREMLGTIGEDSGAIISDVLAQARVRGFAPETLCPYNVEAFTLRPSEIYYREARRHLLLDSVPLAHDVDSIIWHMASGRPVLVGVDVMPSFEDPATARTGDVPMPRANEDSIGGHAVTLTGWDLPGGWFTFDNSWGEGWGRSGRGRIPIDYVADAALCGEIHAPMTVRSAQ